MAHVLCKSALRPLAVSVWGSKSNVSVLPSVSQLTTLRTLCAPPLTSLRDWHAKQHPWCVSKSQRPNRAFSEAAATAAAAPDTRPKVVFLGTPEVAADVLFKLLKASQDSRSTFQIAAVVTQPGKVSRSRKTGEMVSKPHPVQVLARDWLPPEVILFPEKASDEEFLATLEALQPDVCLTAAYGKVLPTKFLKIPRCGTVNIHPSLLPKYRGAAPVQRALQAGDTEVGVSLLYTVREMDAGPIIAQETVAIDSGIQADELLFHLFAKGTKLFLENLEAIVSKEAQETAKEQDPAQVTRADKIEKKEGLLKWDRSATELHNQVRAFTPWPGTKQKFSLQPNEDSEGIEGEYSIKIMKTVVGKAGDWSGKEDRDITATQEALHIKCNDGTVLSVLRLQMPSKGPITPAAFMNGALRNMTMHRLEDVDESEEK
ncbi:hypothetical protein WJX77_010450 [Trebouxia sp. C0004]